MILDLSPDELLSTTRCVRRRLDLERPVEREVLEECLRLAQQAPTAGYQEDWHFVVVTDPDKRAALAELWRAGGRRYLGSDDPATLRDIDLPPERKRLVDSVLHLYEHLHEVPAHVIPCIQGRTDGKPMLAQAGRWTTIAPAAWSFMLAARSRGLGTCMTSFHLFHEREAAEILGIPYDEIMQIALLPVAYTIGTDFKPARRKPLDTMAHWDGW
ncbi:MAG TPA: nitroreductase family protein [Gaiellaceae bacterium]|nr:nitroreductase family protein [Gaiellaceae bacterium]